MIAGRIHDHLSARYGTASIFMDIDAIPYGTDFRDVIDQSLRATDVFLALIGPHWRGMREDGRARIAEVDDPVRVEIETALAAKIPIVPILVGGATMPVAGDLPNSIRPLAFLNAATIDSGRDFSVHMSRLIDELDRTLGAKGKPVPARPRADAGAAPPFLRLLLIAAAIGLCLGLPFAGLWAQVSPPWPRGVAPVTVAIEIAAIAFSYQLLRAAPHRTLHRVWLAASLALGIILAVYLGLVSYFTYETPATKQFWAKGFVCTAEAMLVYKDKCPDLGIDELKDAEYEAERLWTALSVTTIRVSLVMSWLLGFTALGLLVGSFVAQQRSQTGGAASAGFRGGEP